MEPIIYSLPKSEKSINPLDLRTSFEPDPSPKLIKYGFNNIAEQLNMIALTAIPQYRAGLEFDFNMDNKDSIVHHVDKVLKTNDFDQTFGELWEIIVLFSIIKPGVIFSMDKSTSNVINTYLKFTKQNINVNVVSNYNSIKGPVSTVIYKYSDINIDENAAVQFIINELPELLSIQSTGSNMIIQLSNLQTQISAEIIVLLSTLYTESYLYKPTIVSDLADTKYLVLLNLKQPFQLTIPDHPENMYLTSLGIGRTANYDNIIQCMNSDIVPRKYKRYHMIRSYLDTKVYEGSTYQEFIQLQNANIDKWLETFANPDNYSALLNVSLEKTNEKCGIYFKLTNIFN